MAIIFYLFLRAEDENGTTSLLNAGYLKITHCEFGLLYYFSRNKVPKFNVLVTYFPRLPIPKE